MRRTRRRCCIRRTINHIQSTTNNQQSVSRTEIKQFLSSNNQATTRRRPTVDTLRVGVLGLTHDHVWGNLRDLKQVEGVEITAAGDPNDELLDKFQQETGCEQVFSSYEPLLGEVELDAIYVFGDNATGSDLAAAAAGIGMHVLIEKPMAADLDGANRVLAAATESEVTLMINWPFAWWPQLDHAISMAKSGEIGAVLGTRYRSAHGGPKELGCTPYFYNWLYDNELNGAGAYMDYCCYGVALAREVAGSPPSRVSAIVGHLHKDYVMVDDNAVLTMQWPRNISVADASWTQIGHLTSYSAVIYGSEGTLLVEPRPSGRLLLATREHEDGIEVNVPELPPERRSASAYFVHCIRNGAPVEGLCSGRVSRDAQEILEAGLLSSMRGEVVSLPLSVY
jgi:predicted dehydrogenase